MAETSPGLATISQGANRPPPPPNGDNPARGENTRSKNIPVIKNLPPKENLLIWQERNKLEQAIREHSTIILAAGTGTGKTRGGSQIALEALGPGAKMIVTENLRRATEDSAKVVACDMQVEIGREVGIQNRYTHKVSDDTRLLFCPVQSLLIKMERDHLLTEYNLVAMDEVHKESKANELCMIKLRDIQAQRKAKGLPELKLMFISATADKEKIMAHFPDAVSVDVPGKTFPVDEVFETKKIPAAELPRRAAEKVRTSIEAGDKGNILVFLSGKAQIDEAAQALESMGLSDIDIIRYASVIPKEEQARMFEDSTKRKVVFATNAAQESLTLDVNVVVDTGMHKHMEFDEATGRQYLIEQEAPRDHLIQRRGRVGRKESPYAPQKDKYYALTTKEDWNSRVEHEAAEMQRSDLTQEMLILLAQGHTDLYNFKYINPPPRRHIEITLRRLEQMGAYRDGKITPKGEFMASLQLKPNLSSMVASGMEHGCTQQASQLAAMLETYPEALEEANNGSSPFKHPDSDVLGLLEILSTFNSMDASGRRQWAREHNLNFDKLNDARDLNAELLRTVKEKKPDVNLQTQPAPGALDKSIYEGFADSLVKHSRAGDYFIEGVLGQIQIDRNSVLYGKNPKFFVTLNLRPSSKDGKMMRFAELNHLIPEDIAREIMDEKAPSPASPSVAQEQMAQEAPSDMGTTADEAQTETPPPKPAKLIDRIKAWISSSWIGKLLKWISS